MNSQLSNIEQNVEILPNVVYYNDDHSKTTPCTKEIAECLKLTYTCPSTWCELAKELEAGQQYLGFHVDMLSRSMHSTPAEFIDSIQTMSRYIPQSADLKIVVIITPTTPLTVIKTLQAAGVQGIALDLNYYSVEEAAVGANAHLNGIPWWPKHILDKLPTGRPLSIYFRQDWDEYKHTFDLEKFKKIVDMDLAYCSNWNELDEALDKNPHQLIFHITELERMDTSISEIVTMLKTRLKIHGVDIPIGAGFMPYTTIVQIRELKRAGIHSIIPNAADWGIQETITAMHALRDRVSYWPKHIIDQLPGSKKPVANADNVTLTNRQNQVFHLVIERGASNKSIAKIIGISESTVKLHLTEIFKKYGVRNRTQLAVFSHVT